MRSRGAGVLPTGHKVEGHLACLSSPGSVEGAAVGPLLRFSWTELRPSPWVTSLGPQTLPSWLKLGP